jgi:hypothetical protein
MSKYFSYFPITSYTTSPNGDNIDLITNIMTRFKMEESFKNNTAVYNNYTIKDGDTPESIAYNFYGDVEYHWVVLLYNNILDPQFNWPLEDRSLSRYINSKYESSADTANNETGLVWSRSNIHSYYKIERRTTISTGDYTENTIEVNVNTYANIATTTSTVTVPYGKQVKVEISKQVKTYYEYEIDYNERNRTINLLKPEFVNASTDELKRVLGFR